MIIFVVELGIQPLDDALGDTRRNGRLKNKDTARKDFSANRRPSVASAFIGFYAGFDVVIGDTRNFAVEIGFAQCFQHLFQQSVGRRSFRACLQCAIQRQSLSII